MPCWQVQTMSVAFSAKHLDVLEKATKSLGWTLGSLGDGTDIRRVYMPSGDGFTLSLHAGQAVIRPDQQEQLNQLKRAYATAALKKAATKQGWQVTMTTPQKGYVTR